MATELDELKGVWNDLEADSTSSSASLYIELQANWIRRRRKLWWKFIIELMVYLVIYTGAILIITIAATSQPAELFGWKVVLLSLIFSAPVVVSLYQSIAEVHKIDFTTSVMTHIDASIEKLRTSRALYVRYSYLFSGFMMVTLFTDTFFLDQPMPLKVVVIAFTVMSNLLVKPYFRMAYGRDIRHLEQLRTEMKQ